MTDMHEDQHLFPQPLEILSLLTIFALSVLYLDQFISLVPNIPSHISTNMAGAPSSEKLWGGRFTGKL